MNQYIITEEHLVNKICKILVDNGENNLANKLCSCPHAPQSERDVIQILMDILDEMGDVDGYSGKGAKDGYLVCDDDIKEIIHKKINELRQQCKQEQP